MLQPKLFSVAQKLNQPKANGSLSVFSASQRATCLQNIIVFVRAE